MKSEVVSVLCGGQGPRQSYFADADACIPLDNTYTNKINFATPCEAYQALLEHAEADILIYFHDDVTVHSADWRLRVENIFENRPDCVCVGFGGATQLGSNDLYKMPYYLSNMARQNYASNQTDWKTHGSQEKGDKRVVVVDAFFMAVHTDFLRGIGGWPVDHLTHHCLDLWLACEAARAGKEVWMAGISCTHHGGGSSTKPIYQQAKWLQGGTLEMDHQLPHRWLFEEYRDVLPLKV